MPQKKKRATRKKSSNTRARATVKKSYSKQPSVNINVANKKPVWQTALKIVLIAILLITVVSMLLYPFRIFNGFFNKLFGIGQQNIDIDAFADTDTNNNGGLTLEQIIEETADDNCPTHSDVSDTLYIKDYNDFVCIYKKLTDSEGKIFYPNIVFVKTTDGLKYNGALNMVGNVNYDGAIWAMNRTIKITQDTSKEPEYTYTPKSLWNYGLTSLCLLDSTSTDFCQVTHNILQVFNAPVDFASTNTKKLVLQEAQRYLATYIYPYFLKFCNNKVEIIQDKNSASADFNAFYDYIYKTAYKNNGTCMVDVSQLACYPLPADKLNTYPKNESEYFSVYKCNINILAYYTRIATSSCYENNKSVADGVKADKVTPIELDITPQYVTSMLIIQNNNNPMLSASAIKNLLVGDPITIQLFNQGNLTKTIIIDADSYISSGGIAITTGLPKAVYTYKINSNHLIFDSTTGAFSVVGNSTLKFYFDYADGMVATSFKIEPAANVNYSTVDFEANPTKILLAGTNGENYTFTFDNPDKVNIDLTQPVKTGTYTVTIISDVLEFATTNYTVTISNTNRNFVYQFAVKNSGVVIEKQINSNVTIYRSPMMGLGGTGTGGNDLKLEVNNSSINAVKQYLNSNYYHYSIKINNALLSSFNYNTGEISLNLTSVAEEMTDNQQYSILLTIYYGDKSYDITYNYTHRANYYNTITVTITYQ